MSATFMKFNVFVGNVGLGKHNLNTDTLRDMLTNATPDIGDTVVDTTTTTCTISSVSSAAEIAAGQGYTKKGAAIGSNAYSQTSGTGSLTGGNVVYTASGGTIGPFEFVCCYDDTAGSTSTRPPIGWWSYGSAITLADGETFTIDHSGGILTIGP